MNERLSQEKLLPKRSDGNQNTSRKAPNPNQCRKPPSVFIPPTDSMGKFPKPDSFQDVISPITPSSPDKATSNDNLSFAHDEIVPTSADLNTNEPQCPRTLDAIISRPNRPGARMPWAWRNRPTNPTNQAIQEVEPRSSKSTLRMTWLKKRCTQPLSQPVQTDTSISTQPEEPPEDIERPRAHTSLGVCVPPAASSPHRRSRFNRWIPPRSHTVMNMTTFIDRWPLARRNRVVPQDQRKDPAGGHEKQRGEAAAYELEKDPTSSSPTKNSSLNRTESFAEAKEGGTKEAGTGPTMEYTSGKTFNGTSDRTSDKPLEENSVTETGENTGTATGLLLGAKSAKFNESPWMTNSCRDDTGERSAPRIRFDVDPPTPFNSIQGDEGEMLRPEVNIFSPRKLAAQLPASTGRLKEPRRVSFSEHDSFSMKFSKWRRDRDECDGGSESPWGVKQDSTFKDEDNSTPVSRMVAAVRRAQKESSNSDFERRSWLGMIGAPNAEVDDDDMSDSSEQREMTGDDFVDFCAKPIERSRNIWNSRKTRKAK